MQVQEFSYTDSAGVTKQSQNIICRLDGIGFIKLDEDGKETSEIVREKWVVIGAHYDVPVTGPDYTVSEAPPAENGVVESPYSSSGQTANVEITEAVEETAEDEDGLEENVVDDLDNSPWQMEKKMPIPVSYRTYDGINNNASGVGCVISIAKEMLSDLPGYDTTFVFFGAGADNYAGARAYLENLSPLEHSKLEAMYNIEAIFAGDKVYAHAGTNSVKIGNQKDYHLRRKLYEATDVFYKYRLNTNNAYSLYTNQSGLKVDAGKGGTSIFSEWTAKASDHTPFDLAGIPVVYFESAEYNINDITELGIESRNPNFSSTGGKISSTPFDSSAYLTALFKSMAESNARSDFFLTPSPSPTNTDPPLAEHTDNEGNNVTSTTAIPMKELPRLEKRINSTAFIIIKSLQRGPAGFTFGRR